MSIYELYVEESILCIYRVEAQSPEEAEDKFWGGEAIEWNSEAQDFDITKINEVT